MAFFALTPSVFAAEMAVLRNGFTIRHQQREEIGSTTRLYLGADHNAGFVDVPTSEITGIEPDDSPAPPPQTPLAHPQTALPSSTNPSAGQKAALTAKPAEVSALVNQASDQHRVDADLIASVIQAESSFHQRAVSPKGAQGLMQLMPGTAGKLGVKDSFNPTDNIDGGTRYLRELLLRYNGDMAKALAAYNAGPERVDQYHGVPPYRETHAYVVRVIKDFNRKKRAQAASAPKNKSAAKNTQSAKK
jgi:soluble lytic murein transglycosylase-like protein